MRTILHSDCNSFYASVESVYDPSLRSKPVAVCGDPAMRHGIVLTKNELAKKCGIITGEAVWQARKKCPTLTVVPPDCGKYLRFSKMMRDIYRDYTERIEPFGLDESWLDVTGSSLSGAEIASRIRLRARNELGITVSVGVSFNKVFAKLASDMHKPDATTVITEENFRRKIWPLHTGALLYVGRATQRRLASFGIETIGDIARADPGALHALLGKCGDMLYAYACGADESPVEVLDRDSDIKSVGNSTTPPSDIACDLDAKRVILLLADSVASRLRRHGLVCATAVLWIRDTELNSFERQMPLAAPSDLSGDIGRAALRLLRENWNWRLPLRSLGVRGCDLRAAAADAQLSLFPDERRERDAAMERVLDRVRARYGYTAVQRCTLLTKKLGIDPNISHNIASVSFSAINGRL